MPFVSRAFTGVTTVIVSPLELVRTKVQASAVHYGYGRESNSE